MDENLTQTQPSVVPSPSLTTPPVQPQKGKISLVLVVIHLIAVATVGYFVYQNMQLKKQTSSPQPTPLASIAPTTLPTTDPTANWKTYLNTSANYSIKYPQDWGIENVSAGGNGLLSSDARYIRIFYKVSTGDIAYGNLGIEETDILPPSEEKNLTLDKRLNSGLILRCNGNFTDDTKTWCWVKVPNKESYLNIQVFKGQDSYANNFYDQILSTFKFTQ